MAKDKLNSDVKKRIFKTKLVKIIPLTEKGI